MKVEFNDILLVFIGWILAVSYNYRQFGNANYKKGTTLLGFFIIYLIFSVFDFSGGDFKLYYDLYNKMLITGRPIHVEDVYYQFVTWSQGDFYLFRLITWGISLIFLCLAVKRLKLSPPLFTLLMLLMYFVLYIGARQSLGLSILYLGVSFVVKPIHRQKHLSYLIFAVLCGVACFFHKSMPLYVAITIMAICIRLNKKMLATSAILYPILYASLFAVSEFVIANFISDEYSKNGLAYLYSEDTTEINFNGIIQRTIDWIPIFLLYFMVIKDVIKQGYDSIKKNGGLYFKIAFTLFYAFLLFLGQPTSKFLSPRFYDASLLPMVLFCSSYLYNKRNKRIVKIIFFFLVLSQTYRFLYGLYRI